MNKEDYLNILLEGAATWNKWRRAHYGELPDLSGVNLIEAAYTNVSFRRIDLSGLILSDANLTKMNLSGADLSHARFDRANLSGANLTGATLSMAHLPNVDLSEAQLHSASLDGANCTYTNLRGANLSNTNLRGTLFNNADFAGANLSGAFFHGADLIDVNLNGAKIGDARFHGASMARTYITNVDLRNAIGLEQMNHYGPSIINSGTLTLSEGIVPTRLLRSCGFKDWEIAVAKLYRTDLLKSQIVDLTYKIIEAHTDPTIQFNSCFISYSKKDEEFANRIYSDLQNNGVRCWYAPQDMKVGDRIRRRLDESIRLHDKLLLIISKNSIASQWVEQEVETALEKEREQGCDVLFPIRLDDTVLDLHTDWPSLIKNTRHIGDFCRWEDPKEYVEALTGLLNALREVPKNVWS